MKPRSVALLPLLMAVLVGLGPATAVAAPVAPAEPFWEELREQPYPPHDILPAPAAASAQRPREELNYRLAVFYAVPANVAFDSAVLHRIELAALDVQAWYQVATGGLTWELAYPEVVRVYHARQTWQYYRDNGSWWGSLLPEMGDEGLPIWFPGTVTAIWAQGAGWWAGAAQGCGADCGVALLGVELFPEFNRPDVSGAECPDPDGEGVEAWPCTPLGAFAHELGHPLGLGHPADDPLTAPYAPHSIMQSHWNYPDQAPPDERPWGFLRTERAMMSTNPFMKGAVDLLQLHQDADIVVNLPPGGTLPTVAFDATVVGNRATFANRTQGATRCYWTFGDRGMSHLANPAHDYHEIKTYTVTLRATGGDATMGVMSREVPVLEEVLHSYLPLLLAQHDTRCEVGSSTPSPALTVGSERFSAA